MEMVVKSNDVAGVGVLVYHMYCVVVISIVSTLRDWGNTRL